MSGFWQVLLLSLLPGAGNFAGGLLAEYTSPSPKHLNWALHVASGIVIAIVAVELMPQALGAIAGWWVAGAFRGPRDANRQLSLSRAIDERKNVSSANLL